MRAEDLTKAQRWEIADKLAQDRLGALNENLPDVTVSNTFYARYGKRIIDIVLSGIALLICLPLNVVLGICTFFDVGFPLFFCQQRAGRDGKPFTIVKFRNMNNNVDERGELLPPNQRITKFGAFMRKTSLDELLNFWSIFKGDMSLIGPRPLVPEYNGRYNNYHKMRLSVRPGLECPPRKLTDHVWTIQEQFDNDVWYVQNISFGTDCKMMGNLVRFALDRKSSNARAHVQRGTFMGYDLNGNAITVDNIPQEYLDMLDGENGLGGEAHA